MSLIDAEHIRMGQLEIIFFASEESTRGHADVFEVVVPEGAKVPAPHFHVDVDEVVYALEGTITYTVGGVAQALTAGQSMLAPKGVEHSFANLHPGKARFLSVLTPAKIGRAYFRELAQVVNAGGPPDPAKVKEVMQRHGLVASPPKV